MLFHLTPSQLSVRGSSSDISGLKSCINPKKQACFRSHQVFGSSSACLHTRAIACHLGLTVKRMEGVVESERKGGI